MDCSTRWTDKKRNCAVCLLAGEAATGLSREDYIDTVANDILVKLPADFDIDKTRKKFGSSVTPTSVVLLQELERFNKLLNRMRRSLITLRKVRCFPLNLVLMRYSKKVK